MVESSKSLSESKSWGWSLEEKIRSSSEDVSRRVVESTDFAIRSVRHLENYSSQLIQSLQGLIESVSLVRRISSLTHDSILYLLHVLQHFAPHYKTYEDAFFNKIKDEVASAREHPALIGGVVTAGLLLMRGPRRFLFRNTFGRLQSEEAQFVRADKNVKQLGLSVNLMKKESEKLLERASLAEVEMKRGHADLMDAGSQIKRLAKSIYKVEAEAVDLMDLLREIPNREALKLRAEVASMVSALRQRRTTVNKRIMRISELGVPV